VLPKGAMGGGGPSGGEVHHVEVTADEVAR
jgi:hypothetical protein